MVVHLLEKDVSTPNKDANEAPRAACTGRSSMCRGISLNSNTQRFPAYVKNSKFEVRLTGEKVNVHAVLNHGSVGPRLIKISTHGVGAVSSNNHAAHAALI